MYFIFTVHLQLFVFETIKEFKKKLYTAQPYNTTKTSVPTMYLECYGCRIFTDIADSV